MTFTRQRAIEQAESRVPIDPGDPGDPGDRGSAGVSGPVRTAVTGLVLCGGASRRMGRDKARLTLGGQSLIARALEVLRPLAARPLLAVGTTSRYSELDVEEVFDREPDLGPLAGLEAGLSAAMSEYVLTVACDMPRLSTAMLRELLLFAERGAYDVALFEAPDGLSPTCAVYRPTCLDPVRTALSSGERRMIGFWTDALSIGRLPLGRAAANALHNVNTPGDYALELRAGGGES